MEKRQGEKKGRTQYQTSNNSTTEKMYRRMRRSQICERKREESVGTEVR